jgi:hypothetical protein
MRLAYQLCYSRRGLAHHTLNERRFAYGPGLIAFGASVLVAWGPAVASLCGQSLDTSPSTVAQPPTWIGSASADLSWQAGAIDQLNIGLAADVSRRTPQWSYYIQADYAYGTVTTGGVRQRVTDVQHTRFIAERTLTPRTFLLIWPAFKRNELQGIDYQSEELAGYGLRLPASDRIRLHLVPVGGDIQQSKRVDTVDGRNFTAGLYQTLEYRVATGWNLVQWFLYLQDAGESAEYRLQGTAMLQGKIIGAASPTGAHFGTTPSGVTVSLTLTYRIDHENIAFAQSAENY